jgi:hypothetical protein
MAKRFIASELWDKDWFLELPSKYKVLWIYMITKCDVAGIFDPNLKTISKLLNEKYTEADIFSVFNGKIRKVQDKWLLNKFINFQYGDSLSPHMIKPINNALRKVNLDLDTLLIQYREGIDTPKDIEKDKEIVIKTNTYQDIKDNNSIPTLDEVIAYCKERGKGVDPHKWFDFYTAKGWMIGKNKMKDWKAAVRTWEQKAPEKKPEVLKKADPDCDICHGKGKIPDGAQKGATCLCVH